MILVELVTGSQRRFASAAELAVAIRSGELDPTTRIYHRATAQWLPITHHPAFRENWVERPLPPLTRTEWTFFGAGPAERASVEPHETAARQQDASPSASSQGTEATPGLRRVLGRAISYLRRRRGS